ncbi:MAG: CHAP domain-containing protein [Pedococcus sp.]
MLRSRLTVYLARAGSVALLAITALAASPSHAGAATLSRECKASSISCISFSGYAGRSVWGYPVNSTGNNCVNYAAYRLMKNGVKQQSAMGSGGSWATSARSRGIRVDTTPATGSIAQWNYGSHYAPGNGHVGYVEEVTSSYIVVSDSAWSGYSSRMTIPRGDANWPSNFLHFKDQPYQPPKSGSFVKVRENGQVYRLAGRTPVYVSTWAAFGGSQPTMAISASALATLPATVPNGTYLKGAQRGEIYKVAGGAPIYISAWANIGGSKAYTVVDQVAIDRAGAGGAYNRLRAVPADATMLTTTKGVKYRVKAGIAYYSTSFPLAELTTPVLVDHQALTSATTTGALKYRHLKAVKALAKITVKR